MNSVSVSDFVSFPSYEAWVRIRTGYGSTTIEEYDAQKGLAAEHARHTHCVECKAAFTDANTHTADGWSETQISGLCEECFDCHTEEVDEEDEDPWWVEAGSTCSNACGYCGRCT